MTAATAAVAGLDRVPERFRTDDVIASLERKARVEFAFSQVQSRISEADQALAAALDVDTLDLDAAERAATRRAALLAVSAAVPPSPELREVLGFAVAAQRSELEALQRSTVITAPAHVLELSVYRKAARSGVDGLPPDVNELEADLARAIGTTLRLGTGVGANFAAWRDGTGPVLDVLAAGEELIEAAQAVSALAAQADKARAEMDAEREAEKRCWRPERPVDGLWWRPSWLLAHPLASPGTPLAIRRQDLADALVGRNQS